MESVKDVQKQKTRRIDGLDFLRGFAILAMIVHHVFYDQAYLFGDKTALDIYGVIKKTEFLSWIFILVSGICTRFSKNVAANGAKILMVAYAMTAVTALIMPSQIIVFGVLHMFAFSMLCFSALEKLLDKISALAGMLISLLLFALFFNIGDGYIGIKGILTVQLPDSLYMTDALYPFGFHTKKFYSSDYWAFFPWVFLFLAGSFIGVWAKAGKFPEFMYKLSNKYINFIGRHSLFIYVVHQPVIYALLWVINKIF